MSFFIKAMIIVSGFGLWVSDKLEERYPASSREVKIVSEDLGHGYSIEAIQKETQNLENM